MEVRLFGDVALPLVAGHLTEDGSFTPDAVAGTGFVPTPGVLVTCWHCVRSTDEGVQFGAIAPGLEPDALLKLGSINRDPRGLDLATAAIDFEPSQPFNLCPQEPRAGLDVWSAGFPLPERPGPIHFRLTARLLRGYITRSFDGPRDLGLGPQPSYELDMLAPAGLSGAPLLVHSPAPVGLRLVGVLYASHDSYTIEEAASVDTETGAIIPEARRYVSFGLAHQLSSLAGLVGEATDGRSLRELIVS